MAEKTIGPGRIDTEAINEAHTAIKAIVEAYKTINYDVSTNTTNVKAEWVGKGLNEFEAQYNILISKIDDFREVLEEIYDALVDAEAQYEAADDELRQNFVQSIS